MTSQRPPWLSIAVYAWAGPTTAIGLAFVLPALIGGGGARWVDGILEVYGGPTAWFLQRVVGWCLPGGASAMTLGHVVLGRSPSALKATRTHERVHVRQCERWGPLFLPAYGLASLAAKLRGRDAYLDNRFERAAYGIAGPG